MMFSTSRGSDNTMLDFRECELGILFSNDDVTAKDHLGPSPEGATIHCGNDRFVEGMSSRDRTETMRHADHFLLIVGDLSTGTSIVSLKPTEDDEESFQRGYTWKSCTYSTKSAPAQKNLPFPERTATLRTD